jgi:SP family sugar:H+ symporter-like MFS transporter
MFYAPIIFKSQGDGYITLTFICMLIHVIATFISLFVTDKLGRRLLLIAGSIGCAIGLLLATLFYSRDTVTEAKAKIIMFDVAIYFFVVSFGLSHGPIE